MRRRPPAWLWLPVVLTGCVTAVLLWNTGRNDLRFLILFAVFGVAAGLGTWVDLRGHENPSVSLVVATLVMWLLVASWIVATPLSLIEMASLGLALILLIDFCQERWRRRKPLEP